MSMELVTFNSEIRMVSRSIEYYCIQMSSIAIDWNPQLIVNQKISWDKTIDIFGSVPTGYFLNNNLMPRGNCYPISKTP